MNRKLNDLNQDRIEVWLLRTMELNDLEASLKLKDEDFIFIASEVVGGA
jgi:hypothetical protein